MSSSQFDDLLGDFGDSSATTTAATTKTTPNGDSGLLLDFNTKSDVSNGVTKTSSSNPLYDFEIGSNDTNTSQSANPRYEFDAQPQTQPSSNPLYDLSSDDFGIIDNNNYETQPASSGNPLYDLSSEDTPNTQAPASANPLYEFDSLGGGVTTNTEDSSVDLLSGTNEPPADCSDDQLIDTSSSNQVDLLGDFTSGGGEQVQQEQPQEVESAPVTQEDSGLHEISGISETNGSNSLLDLGPSEPQGQQETVNDDTVRGSKTENRLSTGTGFEDRVTTTEEPNPSQWPQNSSEESSHVAKESPLQVSPPTTTTTTTINRMSSGVNNFDDDDEEEEGVYENEPVTRDDVVRESDKREDLPSPGLAHNLLAKFTSGQVESSSPRAKREITPPNPTMGGGEYVSEPRIVLEKYEGKAESGVFESEPQINPEIIRSDSYLEEAVPEQGKAKMFAAKYAQLDTERKNTVVTSNREITPDRSAAGPVEYVSEPREFVDQYQGKAESGIFESHPEEIPDVVKSGDSKDEINLERGTAKNLAQRFHQYSVDSAVPKSSRDRREISPESVAKVESGVFENTPQDDPDVIKSQAATEEYVPERGFTKNVAARFKELESTAKSPPLSPGHRKEFTPPRESNRSSGVYESTPETKPDVVMSSESTQEVLPNAGSARSLAQRYKEIVDQNKTPVTSKPKKEITPPPKEAGVGVFENQPQRFQADYNRPAESGILENQPAAQRDDVLRADEPNSAEVEMPESGTAKNLVSKWRQIESSSGKNSPGSGVRQKEFTPPRDEPRITQNSKSPRTPKSPTAGTNQLDNGSVHPSDLPGQYQPQNEPHVFESTPESNPDARRESDTDWSQGMPKKNQAKKMLARFQSIQAEASKEAPKHVPRKQDSVTQNDYENESESSQSEVASTPPMMENARLKFEDPEQVGRSKSMRAAIQVEKCGACDKTVYAMERLEMNKQVYHRACFRCSQCKAVLTPKTFSINNGIIFCTTHYKQNFTTKGNYDEGFGRQQHKKQWASNPSISSEPTATGDKS